MPKVNITNTFAKKVKKPIEKTKEVYSDIQDTGLILEVRATGTKTFYYRYNEAGITHQKKIASTDAKAENIFSATIPKLCLLLKQSNSFAY